MSKDIKFRGRCAFSGVWRYGYFYISKGNCIIRDLEDNESIVLKESIGQYTEVLCDKNGVNYCQDDIVKYNNKNHRLIRGSYAFDLLDFYDSGQDVPTDFFSEHAHSSAEIIGNIHEHPHLLTQHKN